MMGHLRPPSVSGRLSAGHARPAAVEPLADLPPDLDAAGDHAARLPPADPQALVQAFGYLADGSASDATNLQLQEYMNRRSQVESMLATVMKKASSTQGQIVDNLK